MIAKEASGRGIFHDSACSIGNGSSGAAPVKGPADCFSGSRQTTRTVKIILGIIAIFGLASVTNTAYAAVYADRIAASVNGDVILESDVNRFRQEFIRSLVNLPLGVIPPGKRPTDREILDELIIIKMLEQEAAKRNINLDDKAVDSVIDSMKKRNNNMSQDMLVVNLAAKGLTYPDFRKLMTLQFKLTKLIEGEISRKMALNEDDYQRYFKENQDKIEDQFNKLIEKATPRRDPDEMQKPEIPTHEEIFEGGTVRLRQITLKIPSGARRHDAEKAQALAKRIFQGVLTGEDFAKLAQQYSQDSLAKKGGDLGTMNYRDMVPNLQKMVQRMKPGDVTPPLGDKSQILLFYLAEAKGRHSKKVPIPEKQRKMMEERLKQEYERQAAHMRQQAQASPKAPRGQKSDAEDESSSGDNVKITAGILTPDEIKEYKKVRGKVMVIMRSEKTREKMQEWIGQLKKDSIIEVKF